MSLNIALFGAPGCGKGTQSALLKKEYNLYHLSTGDLLREIRQEKTSVFYEEINSKILSGQLVTDDIIFKIVKSKIKEINNEGKFAGIIFDGFPRNLSQGKFLMEALSIMNLKLDYAFILNVSLEIVVDRILNRFNCIKCGAVYNAKSKPPIESNKCDECGAIDSFSKRNDDTEEVIKNRLDVFKSNMMVIKNLLGDVCIDIDASQPTKEIFEAIKKHLQNKKK